MRQIKPRQLFTDQQVSQHVGLEEMGRGAVAGAIGNNGNDATTAIRHIRATICENVTMEEALRENGFRTGVKTKNRLAVTLSKVERNKDAASKPFTSAPKT